MQTAHHSLLFLSILFTLSSSAVVPFSCTPREGNVLTSSPSPSISTVECMSGEEMVSCGTHTEEAQFLWFSGDRIVNIPGSPDWCGVVIPHYGPTIDIDSLVAVAYCCTFPADSIKSKEAIQPQLPDSMASTIQVAECSNASFVMTGCGFNAPSFSNPDFDPRTTFVGGHFIPNGQDPPLTQLETPMPTQNQCEAEAGEPGRAFEVAQCFQFESSYNLKCQTVSRAMSNSIESVSSVICGNPDDQILDCNAWVPARDGTSFLVSNYMDINGDCVVEQTDSGGYISVNCCHLETVCMNNDDCNDFDGECNNGECNILSGQCQRIRKPDKTPCGDKGKCIKGICRHLTKSTSTSKSKSSDSKRRRILSQHPSINNKLLTPNAAITKHKIFNATINIIIFIIFLIY